MTLDTELNHVETVEQYKEIIENNEKVMICCGRMGPMCLPVYDVMEQLEDKRTDVKFYDMLFDSQVAMQTIRALPEVRHFNGLPFTIYYRNGKVVEATSSIQNKAQITKILDEKLGA